MYTVTKHGQILASFRYQINALDYIKDQPTYHISDVPFTGHTVINDKGTIIAEFSNKSEALEFAKGRNLICK